MGTQKRQERLSLNPLKSKVDCEVAEIAVTNPNGISVNITQFPKVELIALFHVFSCYFVHSSNILLSTALYVVYVSCYLPLGDCEDSRRKTKYMTY